jgi:hypothetical protein
MKIFFLATINIICLITFNSNALSKNIATTAICNVLNSYGKKDYQGTLNLDYDKDYHKYKVIDGWGCHSPLIEFGNGVNEWSLKNNIAYYVTGSEFEINKITFILNINYPKERKKAHQKLLDFTEIALKNTTSTRLPSSVKEAILNGKNLKIVKSKNIEIIDPLDSEFNKINIREGLFKIENLDIKIIKDIWSNGNGYHVELTIS